MSTSCTVASRALALLICAGLCHPPYVAAARTTYKWLDDRGNVTYGDHPPLGVTAQTIRISTGTASSLPADPLPAPADQPATVAAADTGTGLSAAQAAELCRQARTNLEVLESHALIRQTDANGEVRILDDGSKQQQIATARDIIKAHCR